MLALHDKGAGKGKKIRFHFRDHGSCPKRKDCPYSHDKELRKQALADRSSASGSASYAASSGAGPKGGGKAKAKAKASPKGGGKGTGGKPKICPFFAKNGSCKKGANCDMVHSLPVAPSAGALPSTWTPPSSASMANPFAAFSIQVGSAGISLAANNHVGSTPQMSSSVSQGHAVHSLPLEKATPNSGKLMSLDELPQDWWHIAENEAGGYQYRTVVRVLGKSRCAGSNHVTEELVVGMLNHAKSVGIGTEWVHPEFVHGIAAGSPVPLKGGAVIRVRLLEGKAVDSATEAPEVVFTLPKLYPGRGP